MSTYVCVTAKKEFFNARFRRGGDEKTKEEVEVEEVEEVEEEEEVEAAWTTHAERVL